MWKHVAATSTTANETRSQSLVRRRYGCSDAGPNVPRPGLRTVSDSVATPVVASVMVLAAVSVALLNRPR